MSKELKDWWFDDMNGKMIDENYPYQEYEDITLKIFLWYTEDLKDERWFLNYDEL